MANSAFGDAYFQESHDNGIEALKGYKSVLECKGKEDSLVNFMRWEPRHKKFRCCHPWDQYLLPRLGRADAIGALDEDPRLMHRYQLRVRLSRKGGRGRASDDEVVLVQREDAKAAAETLKGILKTGFWHHDEFLGTLPAVAVASLLIDTVACVVKIIDSVEVLSTEAKFEKPDPAFFTLASTNSDSEISKLDFFII
ncbi:aluminum-activated malate transporter 2-like [Salvia splendens]|uniref:aluminum-activated malate transporter 2-like n=1 Tax=Salvia splendens TaxID=180675 RepID=UPI001C2790CE|nr:aluminum-activated malate transporter 2-like [Salvia splendens]